MRWALVLIVFFVAPVQAKLNIFACEPEWAALVQTLGGNQVKVYSATSAQQDPHHIQARPSLIARMRRADVMVCTGAGLESGWLPVLVRRSANPRVQPGQPGEFYTADYVAMLEKPKRLDRSLGDIHGDGNPHIHTSPDNIVPIAKALAKRLQQIDPTHAALYQQNLARFLQQWSGAIKRWRTMTASVRGKRVITRHRSWSYLIQWLQLELVTTIEEKPGVPASLKRMNRVLQVSKAKKVEMILYSDNASDKSARWLAKRSRIPAVRLPYTVDSKKDKNSLIIWFDRLLASLLETR